jgi:hypothetical protein
MRHGPVVKDPGSVRARPYRVVRVLVVRAVFVM